MKLIKIISGLLTVLFLFSCRAENISQQPTSKKITLLQIQKIWVLDNIDGQAITTQAASTLILEDPAKASGNLACNHFFGTMQLQDNKLRINNMASTRKMCENSINNLEMIVSSVLSDWSEVQLNKDTLTIINQAHTLNYKIQK